MNAVRQTKIVDRENIVCVYFEENEWKGSAILNYVFFLI